MVAIFQIFFLQFFPSWSCCFLPLGVVLLKLCWTGIGQIEWPLGVTGSHSGNVLPLQRCSGLPTSAFPYLKYTKPHSFLKCVDFFFNPAIFPFLPNVKCKGIILMMLLASNRAKFTPWGLILPSVQIKTCWLAPRDAERGIRRIKAGKLDLANFV